MYLGPLRYIRSVNDSFLSSRQSEKYEGVYVSVFLFTRCGSSFIHTGLQDLGLWQRMAMGGILGLATLGIHRKSFSTKITLIDLMTLG